MKVKYFGHPDDKPLRSSLNDMKMFLENHCWLDIMDWVEERIDYHKDLLLNANDMETVRGHQAAVSQLEDLQNIPHLFIEELEAIQKQQEQEQKTKHVSYEE